MNSNSAPKHDPGKTTTRGSTWSNIGGIAFFMIAVSLCVFRVQMFQHIPGQPNPHENAALKGFHNEIYFPVRAFITGENPFDNSALASFHPDTEFEDIATIPKMLPSNLAIYAATGFLQLQYAEFFYIAISILLAAILAALLIRKCTLSTPSIGAIAFGTGLMLACLPATEVFFRFPNTMLCVMGVALAIEYGHRKVWLSSLGLLLAFTQPAIGFPVAVLMLLRGNLIAVLGGFGVIAIASLAVAGYINSNGGPPLIDMVYWQAFDLRNYVAPATTLANGDSIPAVNIASAIKVWFGDLGSFNLSLILPAALMIVAGVAVIAERNHSQRIGVISRTGMLIALMGILVFSNAADSLMLLWIPVFGLVVDGQRTQQAFSMFMRFVLGLLLVLPLFNYLATPFLMQRLKIGPAGFNDPEVDSIFSIRTMLSDWNIANAADVEWQLIATVNTLLIAAATTLLLIRMICSGMFKEDRAL